MTPTLQVIASKEGAQSASSGTTAEHGIANSWRWGKGVLLALSAVVWLTQPLVSRAATVTFTPPSSTVPVNTPFVLSLDGQGFDMGLDGGGLNLAFDHNVLNVTSVTLDPIWNYFTSPGTTNNTTGTVSDIIFVSASIPPPSGNVHIGSISFNGVGTGTSPLTLTESTLNPFAVGGATIPVTFEKASVTVVPEPATGWLLFIGLGALVWVGGRRVGRLRVAFSAAGLGVAALLAGGLLMVASPVWAADADGDGVDDAIDNCINTFNPDQRDTDGDGIGNACDADLNQDRIVNVLDLGLMKKVFLKPPEECQHDPACMNADLNGDGIVNVLDLGLMKRMFLKPPGPSCAAAVAVLAAGAPGESLLDPKTLLAALPIINIGKSAVQDVKVWTVTLADAELVAPAPLPFPLGGIPPQRDTVLDASFAGQFAPATHQALTVKGTYAVGAATHCFALHSDFELPPAAPGEAGLTLKTLDANKVQGAPFEPQPPDFDDEVNPPLWRVPTAPLVPGTPTPTPTGAREFEPAALARGGVVPLAPGIVVFPLNNSLGLTSGASGNLSTIAEPSGATATGGGVVFVTTNWSAAYSTDGGNTFTQLNPTTIFPADAVGFCCDQIVQYVPSIDRFIWLLQGNGYRLASARPADIINSGGTAWTYWNLTPNVFGACGGFDYPDLSVGNGFLYLSWDAGFGGCTGGFQVARISLAGIQAAGTITIQFTNPALGPMAWGSHVMQDTGNEVFWAGHNNNSNMRVFSLPEASNIYSWRDVGIFSWANNAPTALTPDGQDWLAKNFNGPGGNSFPRNGIIGATRVSNQLWFAWTAGTTERFKQAHIEMVTLDRNNNFNLLQQVQVWNPSYAFAYPALATNPCTNEVGMSFEFGGGGNYENHVVGFWGDFVAYITTGSDIGTTRFGDYVTIRQTPPTTANPGNLFSAFGYGLNIVAGGGMRSDIHYVLFGRPANQCRKG